MKKFVALAFLFSLILETGCTIFPIQGGQKHRESVPTYNVPSNHHPFPVDRHRNSQARKHRNPVVYR